MSLKYKGTLFTSWSDIDELIDILAEKVATELPHIENIHGIARGGLVPAVMLSHKLDLPYTEIISTNTLVVDDICDSGETLINGLGVYTATLFYKPHTSKRYTPRVFAKVHNGNEWVKFPWEKSQIKQVQS